MSHSPENDCSGSVNGWHSLTGADGRCLWCGNKIKAKQPRVRSWATVSPRSPLDDAYRRSYDPDWGVLETDSDPL